MSDRDTRTSEEKKADIRYALDVLQLFTDASGKLNARKLAKRIAELEAEKSYLQVTLDGLRKVVDSDTRSLRLLVAGKMPEHGAMTMNTELAVQLFNKMKALEDG